VAFGTHAAVGENLGDRIPGGRALLALVSGAERLDVVERMIVADVLECVGNALDEVFLLDRGHFRLSLVGGRGAPPRGGCLFSVRRSVRWGHFSEQDGLGHHAVDPGHGQRRAQKKRVDDDLPHDRVLAHIRGIDEGLQQMDRRDADDRRRQLDLEHPGIDMREPFRLVGVAFEVESGDKGFVAADDHHDQQVGDHHHVDQAEDDEHHLGFADPRAAEKEVVNQVPQLDHEQIDIGALGDDQAQIERRLQPAAPEDEHFEFVYGRFQAAIFFRVNR
jgi:hypothetical protein